MTSMVSLWASVIAVAGTLAGGLLGGVLQARSARVARRETRAEDRRTEALAALTALLSAVADHRRARWDREDLRLSDADQDTQQAARAAGRITRAAITAPLATVSILLPELADTADAAIQATYAIREVPDRATLDQLRTAAVAAERQLQRDASGVFAPERRRPRLTRRER
ncbi:protein kilB [Actinophytocola sediminis]